MAIGWLAVLQTVPWADVISNAPLVADGAKKLWSAIAKKPLLSETELPTQLSTASSDADAVASLQTRVAALETASTELHNQLLASSELIKALAEQNTQLIKRIETNRMRLLWLTSAVVIIGITVIAYLVLLKW